PHIGQRFPAVLASYQETGLDEPYVLEIKSLAGKVPRLVVGTQHRGITAGSTWIVKSLADDGADGKVETLHTLVFGADAGRHPDGAQLVRIVAEERRVQIVGYDALVQCEACAVAKDDMPFAQALRPALGKKMHRRRR